MRHPTRWLWTLVGLWAVPCAAQAPAAYDLRSVTSGSSTLAWVPAIQDQGYFSDCWTFAAATAIESNLLKNGLLPAASGPPPVTVSSWHLSAFNGAPESLVPTGQYDDGSYDFGWGGYEYQTTGYLTRGQGSWSVPNVPSPPSDYITSLGGGPVAISGTMNAFPQVLVTTTTAVIGPYLPPVSQTPAWQTRQVVYLQQGFSNNVGLPAPISPGGSTYVFNQGVADPQVQAVKNAILSYGAVTTSMKAKSEWFTFTPAGSGGYTVTYVNPGQDPNDTDHEVTIIGWSDSQNVGSGTGAWLVQNSWGTSGWTGASNPYPNDGTFWASYDDPAIGRMGVAAFVMGPSAGYAPTVLQNELGPLEYASDFNAVGTVTGLAQDQHTAFASVLTPAASGSLAALGVTSGVAGTPLGYAIWSGWSDGPTGTLLASGSLTLGSIGYQLIDLAAPVPLVANQGITVVLTYGSAGAAGVVVGGDGLYGVTQDLSGRFSYPVAPGLSYFYDDSASSWTDLATKAYAASGGTSSADTTGGVLFVKGIMVAAVPEPAPLGLVVVAAAAWPLLRRRVRQKGWASASGRVAALVLVAALLSEPRQALAQDGYTSPFSITLSPDIGAWTSDFVARKAVIDAHTSPPKASWYAGSTSYDAYPYGPLNPQLYSSASIGSPADAVSLQFDRGESVTGVPLNTVPGGVDQATWQRQRVLAVANELLQAGTHYQHLHLPNFDPAQVTSGTGFPWIPVSNGTALMSSWQLLHNLSGSTPNPYAATYGRPAPGIDCTDFTAYAYSLALGIQMHSGTPNQIEFTGGANPAPGETAKATVLDSNGDRITPQFFYGPNFGQAMINTGSSLDSLVAQFEPGDLLYIGDPNLGILHVVMWLGQTGTDSAGNTFPLVISSHDNTPAIFDTLDLDGNGFPADGDVAGHLPPPGVHILPFAASNWFYQDFQVAMRVVAVPEPCTSVLAAVAVGGLMLSASVRRHTVTRLLPESATASASPHAETP